MSDISMGIIESGLWSILDQYPDFQTAVKGLRTITEIVAAKIGEVIPDYTDHSITHMDSLWVITDKVFIKDELDKFTPSEAFILACCFYIHDLGMAVLATREGVEQVEQSDVFKSSYERLMKVGGIDSEEGRIHALKVAARELHAQNAESLIDQGLPGLDRYLLESKELRDKWGAYIGQVAASHHWSLQEVNRKLGLRGKVPDPIGKDVDLGFLACALRVIDYAHINASRASSLDRILRSRIDADSLRHWDAQKYITGPRREGNVLIFGSTRPIENVDGWWTFFEMASGLDKEIAGVNEYLSERAISVGRFSLEGVKGVKDPQSFASYVLPKDFEPVDIRFRPDSMERLVSLLGGRTLYGDDYFAPIRELLQNARDAILLQEATAELHDYPKEPGEIRVTVESTPEGGTLSVNDNGIGMNEHTVTNYLLGIASDYWNSPDFFSDHPGVASAGFKPVGRFGIGFLSVFMIGDDVEVHTQKRGGSNLKLRLRGVGRRGSLVTQSTSLRAGTTVRVKIGRESLGDYDKIERVIRAKAPLIGIPIKVTQQGTTTTIAPDWWKTCSQGELLRFLSGQLLDATTPERKRDKELPMYAHSRGGQIVLNRSDVSDVTGKSEVWLGQWPEAASADFRILAAPSYGHVILCSKGFVVGEEEMSGMMGLVDIGEIELNAARSKAIEWKSKLFKEKLMNMLSPRIESALKDLSKDQSIPSRYKFLVSVGRAYGIDSLVNTELPWITIVEPPGVSHLVSPATLRTLIGERKELVILYGSESNPWSVASISRSVFPETSKNAILLPVSSESQPDVGSYSNREVIWGPLSAHFIKEDYWDRDYTDATLLIATLKITAAALQNTFEEIIEMKWARKYVTACLRLTRD